MKNSSSSSGAPQSSLSTPGSSRQLIIPFLAGLALVALGVFVYFQFFPSSSVDEAQNVVAQDVDERAQEGADSVINLAYQADYDEGYSAGYIDGRSESGEFYDSYHEPAMLERQGGYFEGYYAGFLRGCEEGDFDCSEIENFRLDYESGYDAGYADGYGETSEFFDSYIEPIDESRQQSYLDGYFDGFLIGCEDGNFDCSEVQAHLNVYDEAYVLGYVDGYSETGAFLDSYVEPSEEAFVSTYTEAYFDGFLSGCDDGDFDCSDVAAYRDELEEEGAADAVLNADAVTDVQ